MKAPENRRGMKRAAAKSVVAGDWIYRAVPAGSAAPTGDYMMIVASIGTDTYEGNEVYVYSGDVFALKGEGAGPQGKFLGEIEAHLAGTGTWMSPLDGSFVIGCPLDEGGDPAEWGFDTTE